MKTPTASSLSASTTNLKRLVIMRFLVMLGQAGALIYAWLNLETTLNYTLLISSLLVLGLINLATLYRLKRVRPVSTNELLLQLLLDIGAIGFLLYFSGGATNPFASYLLIPVCIASALLPGIYTSLITGLSILTYTLLLFFYHPLDILFPHTITTQDVAHLPHAPASIQSIHSTFSLNAINLHVLGMWINFSITALLISVFVVRMARTLREQQHLLNKKREENLRNNQIVAIASLAAGTAHELGTPLNTMQLLIDELHEKPDPHDLILLKQQISQCKTIMSQLARTAELHQRENIQPCHFRDFLKNTLTHWQLLRPHVQYTLTLKDEAHSPYIATDTTLSQALCNLLNNAADVSDHQVIDVTGDWDTHSCRILIRDYGPGFAKPLLDNLGQPFITQKASGQGMGLGIYLSLATIERFEGFIQFSNHHDGGALIEIRLPITPLGHHHDIN